MPPQTSAGSAHREGWHGEVTELELLHRLLRRVDEIDRTLTEFVAEWRRKNPPPVATSATLTVLGGHMPGSINVDTTNETVTLGFVDDHGDAAAAPISASGATLVATFTSSDPAVATVAASAADALVGDVTVLTEGTSDLGATFAYSDGTPVLEADGVTPFPDPAPVTVTVGPGPAVGDALVLSV